MIAAFARPTPILPPQQLSYRLTSPPTATYQVVASRGYEGSVDMGDSSPVSMKTTAVTRVTLQM